MLLQKVEEKEVNMVQQNKRMAREILDWEA